MWAHLDNRGREVDVHDVETSLGLLTAREVAGMLKISLKTLRRRILRGEFPEPIKLRGSRRWRREQVQTWLAESTPGG